MISKRLLQLIENSLEYLMLNIIFNFIYLKREELKRDDLYFLNF